VKEKDINSKLKLWEEEIEELYEYLNVFGNVLQI